MSKLTPIAFGVAAASPAAVWACSASSEEVVRRIIRESVEYGRMHLSIYVGIALFTLLTHLRSAGRFRLFGILVVPLLLHPTWWDRGSSGDCGFTIRQGSETLTLYGSLVCLGTFGWDFVTLRRRSNSR